MATQAKSTKPEIIFEMGGVEVHVQYDFKMVVKASNKRLMFDQKNPNKTEIDMFSPGEHLLEFGWAGKPDQKDIIDSDPMLKAAICQELTTVLLEKMPVDPTYKKK